MFGGHTRVSKYKNHIIYLLSSMRPIKMESEIKSWLKVVLDESIEDFSIKILGNSEKGDGYVGDIVFVSLVPLNGKPVKEYNLVLKCSKRSQILREKTPIKETFMNEIYLYKTVFPAFTKFQLEKGISDPFDSVPKCYGTVTSEHMEIIVFENMKKIGYDLWDKKKPLTRKHINMVINEYTKFHSVSIAMKDEQPLKFEALCENLDDIFKRFLEISDFQTMFGSCIDDIYDVLKGDLDDNILNVWKSFKEQILFILGEMSNQIKGVKVILHGDCWGNNFMYKHDAHNKILPLKVAILDWQISKYSSPILDLSYFLFASISKEDIEDLDNILRTYYDKLKMNCEKLGSDLDVIYPMEQFLDDWKKYCRFGVLMASLIHKICATEKDEVMDIAQAVENGDDMGAAFMYDVKDKSLFKDRTRHIIKYVVENKLIQ